MNLWASWCGPCRGEMPVLQAACNQHHDQIRFVGVDTKDHTEAAASFLRKTTVTYPQTIDPDGLLLGHLRIPGLPVTLLLDTNGNIVQRHIGPLTDTELDDLLSHAS